MKSLEFDRKSIAVDTKSNENYRTSIRHHYEIAMISEAFDKKSVAFDTKSKMKLQKIDKKSVDSIRNQ